VSEPAGVGYEQGWFRIAEPSPGVYAIGEPLHAEDVRSWLVTGQQSALLIDTGMGLGNIREVVESLTVLPIIVVNSHAHWDHIGGNARFAACAMHPDAAAELDWDRVSRSLRAALEGQYLSGPLPDGVDPATAAIEPGPKPSFIHDGETIDLGGRAIEVIHAPGHSPGLLAFLDREAGALFSTDVAYPGRLYAQFETSNLPRYLESLVRLAALAPNLRVVHPSHNADTMDPSLLPAMHAALREVMDGRRPDLVDENEATHRLDGFGICVPPEYRGEGVA
jgi:glyoxylase-like metal-dependent hydrolase (beta-lactamase superfamily II)